MTKGIQMRLIFEENMNANYLYFRTLFIRFKIFDFDHLDILIAQSL